MSNKDIMARWSRPGWVGFTAWLADVRPKVLHRDNRYRPVVLEPWQAAILQGALVLDPSGEHLAHSMALTIMPRRHGKSTLWLLVCLWLATSRPHFAIGLLGNVEEHSQRVQLRPMQKVVRNTPTLWAMVGGEANLKKGAIYFPHTDSRVEVVVPSEAQSFGDRFNVLWVSDLHAAVSLDPFNAVQASLLDSDERLILIDSNTDPEGGHVHALEVEAETDPAIYCHRVEYRDLAHYEAEAPAWIAREEVRRLRKTTLPASFDRDILGKRSSATNALFTAEDIANARAAYKHPVPAEVLKDLTGGRRYVVGCGVDRSKSLFGGDNTVVTVTLKAARPDGEPEYFVLAQDVIVPNTSILLKKSISRAHQAYKLDMVALEAYEVTDIKPWLDDSNIPCELVAAHDTNQNASFPELHRIVRDGRLHFPEELDGLAAEMRTFVYTAKREGKYSFGHSSTKFHDDRVYSLNWSIFATRATVLNLFTMGAIQCSSLSPHRKLCFLMSGDLELLCKRDCSAWHQANGLFQDYRRLRWEDEISLSEFFATKVKLVGPRVFQGV